MEMLKEVASSKLFLVAVILHTVAVVIQQVQVIWNGNINPIALALVALSAIGLWRIYTVAKNTAHTQRAKEG